MAPASNLNQYLNELDNLSWCNHAEINQLFIDFSH